MSVLALDQKTNSDLTRSALLSLILLPDFRILSVISSVSQLVAYNTVQGQRR